ncbi:OTU domain-containing protein [Pseudomonas sp. Z4-20]|uniref:OTU domain-containing protein n=1 Tax=Pseudomonas sp. Z4-20 TaxID=2817414 RepID=UPI003DA8C859
MREVLPVYLADQQGQRIRHPANGYFITLAGGELARMAVSIDAGGRYEHYLREAMNKTQYKAAWRTAYLANLKFKAYEAGLKEDEVFRATVVDKAFSPPKRQKQVALWLNAVLQSPAAASRALVSGRKVQVHGLLLGGSTGAGERHGTMGNAVSVDGVMFFSDQDGPEINGTVGVYFPDSPQGDDIHELDDLSDGITALLQQAQWQDYFRSRISTADPEEIKRTLGQRVRPLVRGVLIEDDFLEALHRAHVNFHSAYADHRSNSNREVRQQIAVRMMMVAIEVVLDLAGMLLVPGVQLLKRAVQTGALVLRTGAVPMDLGTLAFVHEVARHGTRRAARAMVVPSRGQASFLALTARPSKGGVLLGLPLEQALYRRYAVTDTALTRGFSADSQGFYRPQGSGAVYIRQPDGTVFRVHDQTRRMATEATLVDPVTGLNIRSSGVMRSTVARMPDGEWRAVGFGHGGGKRPGGKSPQPGPSKPKLPALESLDVARSIRTPGSWDNQIMDLVPAIITRLPSWPQNRSLVIIDEITPGRHWSVRFTPGETEVIYPMRAHPNETDAGVLLRRMGSNHYQLVLEDRPVDIPADGDCFFNAIAQGLNEGQAQPRYSIQQLRNEAADYIDHHPELSHYLVSQPSMTHQALFDNARVLDLILDEKALLDLTRIIHGGPNTLRVFEPALNYLNTYASNLVSNQTTGAVLPAEILQMIGSFLAPRSRGLLRPKTAPLAPLERQLVQKYLEGILLGTAEPHLIAELLESRSFMLSQDLNHILLEYGLTTRQLRYNNPLSQEPYVRFDEAIHGNLDEDELEDLLDGAYLVNSDELYDLQHELRSDLGIDVRENAELFDWFKYNQAVEGIVELLEKALTRFPELRRRAEILLSSPVVALNLGGMLRVNFVANLIRNPAISDERLTLIAEYVSTRYDELLGDEHIDVDWMGLFDNRNLRSIVTRRKELTGFLSHVGGRGVSRKKPIYPPSPDCSAIWDSRFPIVGLRFYWIRPVCCPPSRIFRCNIVGASGPN